MRTEAQTNKALEEIRDKLALVDVAMVAYQAPGGELRSVPLQTARFDREANLWFFINDTQPIVAAIAHNPRINLVYISQKEGLYMAVGGEAKILHNRDLQEALWSSKLKRWFPGGPLQDHASLLKLKLHYCEYWDEPRANLFRMVLKAADAAEGNQVSATHHLITADTHGSRD